MIQDIRHAPKRAVVILHGCAHNPTGKVDVYFNFDITILLLEMEYVN